MSKQSSTELRQAITEAARRAFAKLRATVADDKFYSFALYTSTGADYIVPTANTEEGLRRKAQAYAGKGLDDLETILKRLRWNPCDWEHHLVGEEHFVAAQALLDARTHPDELDEAEDEFAVRLKIFVDALKALDKEAFFGTGKQREKVVLLVMMGDQDDTLLLECAKKLNPAGVYKKFAEPLLKRKIGKFKHIGSRNVYETRGAALSRDGRVIATAGDATVLAWTLPDFKEVLRKRLDTISVWDTAISPDGSTVALGFSDAASNGGGGFEFWDVVRQKRVFNHDEIEGNISTVAFSPDGSLFACAGADGIIRLWDVKSRALIRELNGHGDWVRCVQFTADGARLFSSDRDNSILGWDVAMGKQTMQIADGGDQIALSPDDKRLVIAPGYGERPGVARVWDLTNGELVKELDIVAKCRLAQQKGQSQVECKLSAATFSPDGRILAFATSWPAMATLWDWQAEQELLVLDPGGYEILEGLAFLPDGKSIALTGRGFNSPPLIVWDISEAISCASIRA